MIRFKFNALFGAGALALAAFSFAVPPAQAEPWAKRCNENVDAQIDDEFWIYFRTDGTELDAEAIARVERANSLAKARDVEQICIVGQASKEGDADANDALARGRSESVARAFMKRGWRADQIAIKVKGEAWGFMSDFLTNDSEADRRVVVTFSY